eukprot:TRINITY_DN1262_c0_g1_i1.p1 TRINITY_DN1262_c0_g1~~TRINITY_DN1262_c0_g1_i1.p1  ORF type:complete len:132 (-),score=25.33 TRINITY_DN1262_c0_g1_i1:117-512(-)
MWRRWGASSVGNGAAIPRSSLPPASFTIFGGQAWGSSNPGLVSAMPTTPFIIIDDHNTDNNNHTHPHPHINPDLIVLAVPKKKTSPQKARQRRNNYNKQRRPISHIQECPGCGKPRLHTYACLSCTGWKVT